jgi:hypothetical protein
LQLFPGSHSGYRVFHSAANNQSDSYWTPIPELETQDADASLIGILRNGAYSYEVKDTLFQAPIETKFSVGPTTGTLWVSNSSIGFLGCTEQYQICTEDLCTGLGGIWQVSNSTVLQSLNLTENQLPILQTVLTAAVLSRLHYHYYIIGEEILLARDRVSSPNNQISGNIYTYERGNGSGYYYSVALSDDQWRLEAEQTHNIGIASMQSMMITRPAPDTEIPEIAQNSTPLVLPLSTPAEKKLCFQQKIKSSAHRSFNVFGLAMIILIGFLVMVLRFSIPFTCISSQQRSGSRQRQRRLLAWTGMDILHLLSLVLEYLNDVQWEGRALSVPITVEDGKKIKWAFRSPGDSEGLLLGDVDSEERA